MLLSIFARSQKVYKYERRWGFAHPIAALKVKRISKNCFKIYHQPIISKLLDNKSSGGKLDAFRHIFFMAAFAQKIKIKKIKKLGLAHERTNYAQFLMNELENGELPDSIGTVMDLKNNELGFEIGIKNKKENLVRLSEIVIAAINKGEAVIIKRNRLGIYVDCNGKEVVLPTEKKWSNTKCLVKSNEECD